MLENQIEIINDREIELLEKNRKINLQKLFTPHGMDLIIAEIKKEVAEFSANITTKEGRAKIVSMAAKVARCKTPIKSLATELKDESKKLIDGVNAQWNRYESAMDELRDEIRKPVNDIEEREAAELKARQDRLAEILSYKIISANVASTNYEGAITTVLKLAEFNWGEFEFKAKTTVDEVVVFLKEAFLAAKKAEIDSAELAQLKKEKAEREQKDRDAEIAAEAARKAKFVAEMEAAKKAKAEKERVEAEQKKLQDQKVAAEQAKINAELRAQEAERLAKEQAKIAEQNRILAEKKAKEDAEKAAAEAVEKERLRAAEEKRIQNEEAAKREADIKHKAKINNEALEAIMSSIDGMFSEEAKKLSEEYNQKIVFAVAKIIVEAIAKNKIPNVQINY